MIIPLQPKSKSRNPQTLQLRLDMFDRGWPPVACEAKANMHQKWSSVAITKELIEEWDRPGSAYRELAGTGVRLEGEIFVIDLDVSIPEIYAKLIKRLRERWPEWFAGALERTSGGVKRAFFGRISKANGQRRTHRYTAEKKLLKGLQKAMTPEERRAIKRTLNGQLVETFDGSSKGRYFAWKGPHSTAGREYGPVDPDRAPWNTRLDSLPVFPAEDVGELLAICEAVMGEDLEIIPDSHQAAAGVFWDLTPEGTFITQHGEEITHQDLEDMLSVGADNGMRGCRDWNSWSMSDSKAHCNAFLNSHGKLVIHNFQDDATHHMARDKPIAGDGLTEAARERLRMMAQARATPHEPGDGGSQPEDDGGGAPMSSIVRDLDEETTFENAVDWMLINLALFTPAFSGRGGAISIDHDGELQTPVTITALRAHMFAYSYIVRGPRGGQHRRHPVDTWLGHAGLIRVYGVRVRPDMDRPLFEDPQTGDKLCVNRYHPPRHPAEGGTVQPFLDRMEVLIPDAAERLWFLNWLAAKAQNPEWRMVGVAMIARETGTGRGLLAETLTYLFGDQFVVPLPYAKLSGGSGSRFNSEVANALLVYINESREADDRKFAHKNASREALKDFVEPNHRLPFRVEPKGQDAYTTRASVSTIVFTNNIDGLPLSDTDRRIAVLMNGGQMSITEREDFQAWMRDPANIGALHRHLLAWRVETVREIFDPYMAPMFYGRELMVDAGKTAIDRAWDEAMERMASAADLYTTKQVIAVCRQIAKPHGTDFDDLIEKHTISNGFRIGTKNGENWFRTFKGERVKCYAFNERDRKRYTKMPREDVLRQLGMQQQLVDAPGKKFNKNLKALGGGEEAE